MTLGVPIPISSPASPPLTQTKASPYANLTPSPTVSVSLSPSSPPVPSQQHLYGSLSSGETDTASEKPKEFRFTIYEFGLCLLFLALFAWWV
jgi:hypothetical protein